jgi:hypothetical protein
MAREMTQAAQAAKMIRKELKILYPHTTFSVRSDNFAGGNAVRVSWVDGPTTDQVEEITGKYEYGSFDGMRDLYEYTNVRNDIPQAKYITTQRRYTLEAFRDAIRRLNELYGWELRDNGDSSYPEVDPASDAPMDNSYGYRSHEIWRELAKTPCLPADEAA